MTASGGSFVTSDSLVLTASGELGTALSIVWESRQINTDGVVYGMGVHCTWGNVKRLYTRNASGGSLSVPDLSIGELRITERSAALADVITPGSYRWYVVDYRDPVLLGGCTGHRTFNSTQVGQILWAP